MQRKNNSSRIVAGSHESGKFGMDVRNLPEAQFGRSRSLGYSGFD
jgi:hypothetical protein